MKPALVIGKKRKRKRILTDQELSALWHGAKRVAYPYGPVFKLLLLTGLRKSEVAEARWSEFDFEKRLWTIPPERAKSDAAHIVPLTNTTIEILDGLPRFKGGGHLFSASVGNQPRKGYGKASGRKPVCGFGKAKERLDAAMLTVLRESNPLAELAHFVIHDIRRSVRTHLSALPITDTVAELIIGHAQSGLHQIYDQYKYEHEKREALGLWEARLRGIVGPTPTPSNLVALRLVK
jgi:integrase